MFDTGSPPPSVPRPTDSESALDALLLGALAGSARAENQHAFHKVNTATTFHRRWMDRHTHPTPRLTNAWCRAGWVEIATTLACSTTTAAQLVELGTALRERLPKTRAAFSQGRIDHAKAWRLATATAGFGPDATDAAETAALGFAHRYAPAGFTTAIEDVLIRTAPDEYAQLRKDAEQRARRVRRRKLGMLDRIEADLTAAEAAAVWQRLREVAATVCGGDPRDAQQRLVDAYLALMHGEDHLPCRCERDDCAADPSVGSRRTPLVQLTADLATVLGLRNEPAFLPGHGPIDPELARELAQNATLQPILTELVDLALTAGLITPEQAAAAGHADADTDAVADTDMATDTETTAGVSAEGESDIAAVDSADEADATSSAADTAADVDADVVADIESDADSDTDSDATVGEPDQPPPGPTHTDPGPDPTAKPVASPVERALRSRLCHPRLATFVARGSRHRPAALPLCPQAPKPILVPMRQGYLYDEFTELLATCPELADGLYPDGHGGLTTPPPGALTYRPSAELAARVRARDRHCRFNGCTVPAGQCQIDHVRAFDHTNPEAGGWTIESNLQCACAFHHELKTVGLWRAVALPGMAILWTGPRGDRHLTLPAGGLTPVPAADLHTAGP